MFRIARELGGLTVGELSERLSTSEFHEWAAVFTMEADAQKKARDKAKNDRKSKGGGRRRKRGR